MWDKEDDIREIKGTDENRWDERRDKSRRHVKSRGQDNESMRKTRKDCETRRKVRQKKELNSLD